MPHFVTTDAFSNITGLYTDEQGYAAVPAGASQISDVDADLLRGGFSGCQLVNGAVVRVVDYNALKAEACAAIDRQAGLTRLKYITDVAGQSETYLSKATDAANYKAAAYPSASIASYPMVHAEALALFGATPTAVQFQTAADGILTQQAQWIQLAASIEQQRRSGKLAVGNCASDAALIAAARDAAIAALRLL